MKYKKHSYEKDEANTVSVVFNPKSLNGPVTKQVNTVAKIDTLRLTYE